MGKQDIGRTPNAIYGWTCKPLGMRSAILFVSVGAARGIDGGSSQTIKPVKSKPPCRERRVNETLRGRDNSDFQVSKIDTLEFL